MENLFPQCDERLLNAIKGARKAAIIAHRNPDGDAIYSSLAMREVLSYLGIESALLNEGKFDRSDIKAYESLFNDEIEESFIDDSLLVIILDCSTPDRPGKPFEKLINAKRIVIDHHSSGIPFTDEGMSYIVPDSPSTTLLVDKVRESLGVPLTKKMADYLYRGFATDTGFYHFLSEKQAPDSLRRVASFTDLGISPYDIYDEMHDGMKLEDLKMTASIIEHAEEMLDGLVLFAYQSSDAMNQKLSDGVYASLLTAENVIAVVFFKDKGDAIEIGFRAKNRSGLDVGAIASSLGGGGHKCAAGATVKAINITEAKHLILTKLESAISDLRQVFKN